MYIITITNNGTPTVIHEVGVSKIKVDSASISREKNKIDSLSFDVYPENPGYNLLVPFSTLITVYDTLNKRYAFDGRVLQPTDEMDSDGIVYKSVVCEGAMGFLCDSQQSYAAEEHYGDAGQLNGLQQYLKKLLDVHNTKVEDHKKIYLGNVTLQTFDTSSGVTKGIARESTFDNINDKLIDSFGGEMKVRRGSDGKLYLDYAESLGTTRATRIAVGRNMEDASREIDPNSVITRLYPYGAKITIEIEDEEGNVTEEETEERVSISSVNNGSPYIDDAVAIEKYGIIEGKQEWDDVTLPQNLLNKARDWLGNNNAMPVSHKFSAIDLSLIGLDYDQFELYDKYPCYNPLIGVDETLEIVKQTIEINEPENSTIEMGDSALVLSGGGLIDSGVREEFEDFKSQTNTNITNVNNSVKATQASINVFEDRIESVVQEQVQSTATKIIKEEIQQIEIGTRNLVASSRKDITSSEYGFAESELTTTLIPGQSYVFSARGYISYEALQASKTLIVRLRSDDGTFEYLLVFDSMTESTKSLVFVAPEGIGDKVVTVESFCSPEEENATETVTIVWYQLEAGTVRSDWTPAPEDTKLSISDLNSSLADATETINQEISNANDSINEVLALVSTNRTQITELIQSSAGFEFNFQTIQESVTEINNQITTEYSERLKYIKFIDGEIWLGRDPEPNEDDFKLVVTNQRIRFLQNNVEVAYISDQKLYINNATITNRLDLGLFAFFPRSNGNLTLRFFGDGE